MTTKEDISLDCTKYLLPTRFNLIVSRIQLPASRDLLGSFYILGVALIVQYRPISVNTDRTLASLLCLKFLPLQVGSVRQRNQLRARHDERFCGGIALFVPVSESRFSWSKYARRISRCSETPGSLFVIQFFMRSPNGSKKILAYFTERSRVDTSLCSNAAIPVF